MMRKQLYISLLAAILALPLFTRAEEVVVSDTIEAVIDSIVVDEDSIPEWYVKPEIPEALRSPMRATASGCLTDSILTFNADSVLTGTTTYDYDAAGRTIRTTVWQFNASGILSSSTKTEYGFDATGAQIYTASYSWNPATNDWKGSSKSEYVYNEVHKMESQIIYIWVNNTWLPQTAYTYIWDALGRQTEYTIYIRDANVNHLVPSRRLVNDWYSTSTTKKSQEINYTAYSNGAWSSGNRKDYRYDNNGNQIEYTYYSSYSSGIWIGSTQEFWTYNASNKKTYYEKKTWSNGAWANSQKEIWDFNTAGKQTLHKKYNGAGSDWTITASDSSAYDAVGNNTIVENYTYTNGVAKGSKKEEYTYNSANKKLTTIKYKWSSGAFVYNTKAVNDYDAAGNTTETANYSWKNNDWVGTGTRTLKTYNSSKKVTEQITQTWPTSATNWVNSTRTTTIYSGAKIIQAASFTWSNEAWIPSTRTDYHYNSAGKNDTTTTFSTDGTNWVYLNRTTTTYDTSGNTILTHYASWDGTSWIMTSMSRLDLLFDSANRQVLNATYNCDADSVWYGIQKDSAAFTESGKTLFEAHYSGWLNGNWVPSYKLEYEYDLAEHTLVQQRLNWISDHWEGHYRYEYNYDTMGHQIVNATYTSWNTALENWVGNTKSEYFYNSEGQVTSMINYIWRNNAWLSNQKHSYTYDAHNRTVGQIIQVYSNNAWVNDSKYEKEYIGNLMTKDNSFVWINEDWRYSSRQEYTYDEDNQAKLRREVAGVWNNGIERSFSDKHYFYSCDAPASNGSQPRTPTEIEEIDENNANYENNENNAQPFDPTQPTYNLSGQRVDPESYHGVVIQSGHTYLLP